MLFDANMVKNTGMPSDEKLLWFQFYRTYKDIDR